MKKKITQKTTAFFLAALMLLTLLAGCDSKERVSASPSDSDAPGASSTYADPSTPAQDENALTDEEMEQIKYNYYVGLNNDIIEVLDSLESYFMVVADEPEFSLLPDTGLTYGFRVYGQNTDLLDDCLLLAEMDPSFGAMDEQVLAMGEPLRALMETFSAISRSSDYADNQYQKAKEYHAVIYENIDPFLVPAYDFLDAIAEMGNARTAAEEEKMLADGDLIIYNASHAITIGKQVLNEIAAQGITDETITQLDLTELRTLYDELVATVADFDAATADNDQLIKESLANSRPFDGLYDSLIQALEWMIRQVESGRPLDLSGSGAPLGSIGHFSYVLGQCIDRYNSVFVE